MIMNFRNIDLNLFVTFEVIYDSGNLTQAARILNITQPAVSNALARLRDQLQDPLFVHAGKRMNPTPAAEELIGPVRQALSLLKSGIEKDESFKPQTLKRTVRLSIGDVAESVILPKFIASLRAGAPQIKVHAYHLERRTLARKLAASEIDFAIDIPMQTEAQIRQVRLLSETQVCVMAENHPLARTDQLTLQEYLSQEHIHVSSRKKGGGVADLGLSRLGETRNNVVRLQHYQAAFSLLARSEYLLTAPASLTGLYPCKVFDLPFEAPEMELQLYWHSASEQSAINNWIRQKLIDAARDISFG